MSASDTPKSSPLSWLSPLLGLWCTGRSLWLLAHGGSLPWAILLGALGIYLLVSAWPEWRWCLRTSPASPTVDSSASTPPKDSAETQDRPLRSLVFLLEEPRDISDDAWIGHLGEALGVTLDSSDEDATSFVMPMPHPSLTPQGDDCFMLKIPAGFFWIFHVKRPYVEDVVEWASRIDDRRLREAFTGHTAWISVDLLTWLDGPEDEDRIYAVIGKALAALAGPDVRVLFAPDLQRANEFDPMLLPVLSGGQPLTLFSGPTFAPVFQARSDDEQMEAAIAEARRRWPEFVALWQNRDPQCTRPWIVKAPFTSDGNTEHMWVLVIDIKGDTIHGTLANQPHHLPDYHEGQSVTTPVGTLTDWLCADAGDEPLGGWSQKVLNAQRPRRPQP